MNRMICGRGLAVPALLCLAASPFSFAIADAVAAPRAVGRPAADPLAGIHVNIAATRFQLRNGLTVVVHEDHSAPLVAVNIWYHVGSKNEPKGRSGFAHLFEHLMFNGSENFNDDFFKATEKIGASDQNGTTNVDRTNYFQTVPKGALDTILWLESDRMGHLLGAIDQAKLDEQRAVVKNEKRQGDNRPYAIAEDLIIRATTSVGHPYDHSVIGSMEDLDAAKLDDVRDWFRTYYGPSNAVIALAGDITPAEARAKVEKYFGDIAPGTPVSHPSSWVERPTGTVRETAYDRVAQPRLFRVWNVSDYAAADTDYLQILGELLAGDRNSRLYKRLVVDEQIATGVQAGVDNREIGGQFQIIVSVKPDADVDRVERIVDEELQRLLTSGPSAGELSRVRTSVVGGFVRSLESLSSKASQLAESQTFLGSPDGWRASFDRLKSATPADLQRAGRTWLSDGDYRLRILPYGNLAAAGPGADRKTMPMPTEAAQAPFPAVERATLANGLKLVVARRPGVPVVNMTMLVDTGTPADFASVAPGTGQLAMELMDEGTRTRSREQLGEALGQLGAKLSTGGGGETGTVSLSALKPNLRPSLDLFADVLVNPAFAAADIDRVKAQMSAGIASARQDPSSAARRLMPRLVFGPENAYGRMITEASLRPLGRDQLAAFHARWFHPNNATLLVAGDTSLAEMRPLAEAAFAGWRPAEVPQTIAPAGTDPQRSVVYLVDKPGTPQSVIRAALLAPPRADPQDMAREAFNMAFGGSFTSRLNMKLREEKGWAYGANSGLGGGRGARIFSAGASVQADKTAESMTEIAAALKGVETGRPIDAGELKRAQDNMTLGLASDWATSGGVLQYLADEAIYRLPADYYRDYSARVAAQPLDAVNRSAAALVANRAITWLVVGDRAKIEAKIRALNLGEVRVVDADGNPMP